MNNPHKNSGGIPAVPSKILIILIALLAVAQIFLANSLSVQGKEISRLEGFKNDMEREISLLKQRSSTLSSLESIRYLAKQKLNMVDGFDSFDYFGASVALR